MEVLVGTRVVRGPDWSWREQDGGEGHLGTVAEIQAPEQEGGEKDGRAPCVVTVQWDCGGRCRYRCGLGGKYDLRGFDSGPAGVVHTGEVCSACSLDPITGIMWRCARCLEYGICTECYMTGKHVLHHEFDRFVTPWERVRVPARGTCKRREVRGLFKFAEVVPWCDWEPQEGTESAETGEVVRLCDKDNDNSRGFVEVEWKETDLKTVHKAGYGGKVELKCVDPSSGGYYYPDHLPLLGAPPPQVDPAAVSTGDRVRVELEPDVFRAVQERRSGWNDLMLNVIGKVGTVVAIIASGDLKVRYSSENLICTFCPEAVVKVEMPRFKVGDLVKISGDMEKVRGLQRGHGDWSNAVLLMLGEVGRVYAVYTRGDVLVTAKAKSWVFNPLCLSHVSDAKEEITEDDSFAKWAKADADESIKAGLRTMLQKGQGEALFMATSLGEVDILREFLAKHPEMVDFTAEGRTALHYAAMAGLAESMKVLLEFNSMLERQDDTSARPLHTSAYHGSEETTKLLVDAGANVNARTLDGSTPAMYAAMYGKSRSLKVLLSSPDIDVAIQDEVGNTALHAAVMGQKLSCILPLLEAGADPCMLNFSLITPLHYAARLGFLAVLEAFIQNDPECVNSKDGYSHTILHCAAFQDHLDIITLAMEQRGCNVDARSDFGQTPLHMAIARGNTKSAEKLIAYGASVNATDLEGCTPLHYITSREAMEPPSEDTPIIFKLYVALFGKFVEDPSFSMYGIIAVTALLLRKGADIHVTSKNGRSPYQILPFLATLMTVLVDYEDIIDEGGYPDGSPLLRLTDKQRSKKSRPSAVYQDGGHDDSSSSDYFGGQHGNRPIMLIRAPTGYGDGSETESTSAGKRGTVGGGGSGGMTTTSAGTTSGIYRDYNQSYDLPYGGDDGDSYVSQTKSKPTKKPSHQSPSSSTTTTTHSSAWASPRPSVKATTARTTAGGGVSGISSSAAPTTQPASSGAGYSSAGVGYSNSGAGYSSGQSSSSGGTSDSSGGVHTSHSGPRQPAHLLSSSASGSPLSTPSEDTLTGGGGSDELCFMCDNVVDVKFSPCGHAAMCSQCAPKAKRCPVCKTSTNGVYTIVCVNCRKRESKVRQNCGHGMCNSCQDQPVCAGCHEPDD